jgi:hypothetical protein
MHSPGVLDCAAPVPCPPHGLEGRLSVDRAVLSASNRKPAALCCSLTMYADPGEQAPIWDVFLQALPAGGWGLRVLGRAGEPPPEAVRAGLEVKVQLRHFLLTTGGPREFRMAPDEGGLLTLGGLQGVEHVSAVRGWERLRECTLHSDTVIWDVCPVACVIHACPVQHSCNCAKAAARFWPP